MEQRAGRDVDYGYFLVEGVEDEFIRVVVDDEVAVGELHAGGRAKALQRAGLGHLFDVGGVGSTVPGGVTALVDHSGLTATTSGKALQIRRCTAWWGEEPADRAGSRSGQALRPAASGALQCESFDYVRFARFLSGISFRAAGVWDGGGVCLGVIRRLWCV